MFFVFFVVVLTFFLLLFFLRLSSTLLPQITKMASVEFLVACFRKTGAVGTGLGENTTLDENVGTVLPLSLMTVLILAFRMLFICVSLESFTGRTDHDLDNLDPNLPL